MRNSKIDPHKLKELLCKGLELTFIKLLKQKQAGNGIIVISENGKIKKIKALDFTL